MRSMGSVRQASFRLMLRSRTEGILAEMVVRICRNGVLLHSAEDRLIRQQGIVLPSGKFRAANESARLHRAKGTARQNAGPHARQDWPSTDDILWRAIDRQIDDPGRQDQLMQKRIDSD